MKVAFCIRAAYLTARGGDSVQALKTKEWLEVLHPVEIDILTDPSLLHAGYDLVHVFNLSTQAETAAFFEKAKSLSLPIALSTIFWDYSYAATRDWASLLGYQIFTPFSWMPMMRTLNRISLGLASLPRIIGPQFQRFARECCGDADLLLPNSIEELHMLADFAKLDRNELEAKTEVVVNATDFGTDAEESKDLTQYELPSNYVLQIGRIEYVKNQLGVLRALRGIPEMPIVFIGRSNDKKYSDLVKREADKRGNVQIISEVPHALVPHFFRKAAIHVLPSLRESPGLVNLEALAHRCPIAVSGPKFLPFETYFEGIATEIDPLSPASIRDGILSEIRTPRDRAAIRNEVMQKFSWQAAAGQTWAGYLRIAKGA